MARVVRPCGSPVSRRLTQEEANRVAVTPSSDWHQHTQTLRRSRQLLSERVAAPVLLAKIRSPSQELGRATLRRKGDARRDEQRGVTVVLSPGVAEDPVESLLRRYPHRVDGGVA